MISRCVKNNIVKKLFQWKIIILYWARQVWKTTLSKEILEEFNWKKKYLSCDLFSNQQILDYKNPQKIIDSFQEFDLIVLDEAQNIENIWIVLKILVETYPEKQFIATWSSSFELANKINEPLTWRNFKFQLYPLSVSELKNNFDSFYLNDNFENILIYGSYPEVFWVSENEKKERLNLLSWDYLYRDIFKFEWIKKSNYIKKILQLLALQVWSQVSYNEIWQKLWLNHATVQKYIDILEQAFIVFRLNSFSWNIRNELTKSVKIYFWDLWVRNGLIQNFNSLDLRQDVWALWENFLILERLKFLEYSWLYRNIYFWRNNNWSEVDLIEEYNWKLDVYEFKWWKKIVKIPKSFVVWYPESNFKLINKDNYLDFLT
jgi:uncharacterized protein